MCQGGGPLWLQWADWSCGAGGGGGLRKLTPCGWGGAKRGRKLPAVKFPGTRLRGSCWAVVRGWGPAWNSRWGDPGGEIVGRLGAQIPGFGVVCWAGRCPLRRALCSRLQWSPAGCGTRLWGTLGAEGNQDRAGRTRKLTRACTWSRQPLQTTPAASALRLTLECPLSLMTLARGAEFHLSPLAPHVLLFRPPAQPSV